MLRQQGMTISCVCTGLNSIHYLSFVFRSPSIASLEIVIAVVACGMRLQETLILLKSAIIFHTDDLPLKFIIITEISLMIGFREKLEDWQKSSKNAFSFEILPLTFPKENEHEWRTLFKPCAAQRLFLPVYIVVIQSEAKLLINASIFADRFKGHRLRFVPRHRYIIPVTGKRNLAIFHQI